LLHSRYNAFSSIHTSCIIRTHLAKCHSIPFNLIYLPQQLHLLRYGFHEIPRLARGRVASEAHRILANGGKLAVIDISCDYDPSPAMLSGEPYVLEYKKNIHQQMEDLPGFVDYTYQTIVPGHVGMWLLTADKSSDSA